MSISQNDLFHFFLILQERNLKDISIKIKTTFIEIRHFVRLTIYELKTLKTYNTLQNLVIYFLTLKFFPTLVESSDTLYMR